MRVVSDLTYEYSGHGVIYDNFYPSDSLVQFLLKRKMTTPGTTRKNKTELPKGIRNKEMQKSSFYFTVLHKSYKLHP